jgi:phosphoserine phosphatase
MPLPMVARRAQRDPVLIFDLDGTVLAVNSFPFWVRFMLRAPFAQLRPTQRLRVAAATLLLLASRKAALIGHEDFKRRVQHRWQEATADDRGAAEQLLIGQLLRAVRPEMAPALAAIASGSIDAVLATAAAADYAEGLGRALGFTHVLATKRRRAPSEPSNAGIRKCETVMEFLAGRAWLERPRIVFTDHRDDLPLIGQCQTIIWFGAPRDRSALGRDLPHLRIAGPEAIAQVLREARAETVLG